VILYATDGETEYLLDPQARCTASTSAGSRCRFKVFSDADRHTLLHIDGRLPDPLAAQALNLMCYIHAPTAHAPLEHR
jgi:hypothetical protein